MAPWRLRCGQWLMRAGIEPIYPERMVEYGFEVMNEDDSLRVVNGIVDANSIDE